MSSAKDVNHLAKEPDASLRELLMRQVEDEVARESHFPRPAPSSMHSIEPQSSTSPGTPWQSRRRKENAANLIEDRLAHTP